MIVQATMDRMGFLHLDPKNKRIERRLKKEQGLRDWESLLFIQTNVDDAIRSIVPRRYRRDLDHGWSVSFRMDEDVFMCMTGV